ncbi:hypothetical protein K6Y31_04590 [Motilimonas cestriensis]|uniref:Phage protein n=1 Tax=Motilimonas cestriensis TaxID=2742685 RepID=A0ABS8W7K1_9GAMM|nr:hypothetical protein [Motilimonas cestriensis]MCE2594087.1 hypothetical protein [Motilimonas cestriensis]
MNDIHKLEILPGAQALASVAAYQNTLSSDLTHYRAQLIELHNTMKSSGFSVPVDAAEWVRERGRDYLHNPKLFENAPLTYVCTLLSELFKNKSVDDICKTIAPATLNTLLARLNSFKLH